MAETVGIYIYSQIMSTYWQLEVLQRDSRALQKQAIWVELVTAVSRVTSQSGDSGMIGAFLEGMRPLRFESMGESSSDMIVVIAATNVNVGC
jgi:hypothetical protein